MFNLLKTWWRKRIVQRSDISEAQWNRAFSALPLLDRLPDNDRQRLRELAILFLHQKSFSGAHGLDVTEEMMLLIALQACLPILNLGIEWYRDWVTVIVYPAGFAPERTEVDEYGLVHRVKRPLSGEAWQRGPVILSWEATENAGVLDGSNVVIHEFVHKLDMLNGAANGFPPLHENMIPSDWSEVFTAAFDDFQRKRRHGIDTGIHDYAATSPAEFIAVLSEVFFEKPQTLLQAYPEVYNKFKSFFLQDPMGARGVTL
jgi:Mlc titration factor MtfA (ptsG expression regulator)